MLLCGLLPGLSSILADMTTDKDKVRLIFGLKLKQLRHDNGISTYELANRTGLSPSYINEIEKGKKYPKTEKVFALAKALGTDYDALVSLKLSKTLEPVAELLNSNILSELPLEMFGLEPGYFLELMASAPVKLSAFVSTLIEIGRNYDLRVEQFYFSVLRTYQAMHDNYFDDLETEADQFLRENTLPGQTADFPAWLETILREQYGCVVTNYDAQTMPDLASLRSVFVPEKNELFINTRLSTEQRTFTLAREVSYQRLGITVRPLESSVVEAASFDEVLNNFRASYLARTILIPHDRLLIDLRDLVGQRTWQPDRLLRIMQQYAVTPEVFLQRITNVLTHDFGQKELFFLRFDNRVDSQRFRITKELHLSKLHTPHGTARDEHYCRRQVAVSLLTDLADRQRRDAWNGQPITGAQITRYVTTGTEYFVITVARSSPPNTENSSINIGFPMDEQSRAVFQFLNDPAIPRTDVGETCERCPIADCTVRVAPARELTDEQRRQRIRQAVEQLRQPEPAALS